MEVEVSNHARRRFKLRTNLPPRAVRTTARRALLEGLAPHDLPPILADELAESIIRNDGEDRRSFIRILDGIPFVFAPQHPGGRGDLVLITVLPNMNLPEDLRRIDAPRAQRKYP